MSFHPGFRFSAVTDQATIDLELKRFRFYCFRITRRLPRQGRWLKNRLKNQSKWRLFFDRRAKRPLIGSR